jgi:hypothetical protein
MQQAGMAELADAPDSKSFLRLKTNVGTEKYREVHTGISDTPT